MSISSRGVLCALMWAAVARVAPASVLFQNPGTPNGWTNYPQAPQHGTLTQVSSPVYKGSEAIRFYQKFEGFGSYHNEVSQSPLGPTGSDTYFGFAIYFPSEWVYHDQSMCFTQWARSDSSNTPWTLMCLQMDYIFTGGSGGLHKTWATGISKGAWHRIVVRIVNRATDGILEVWVDGINRGQLTGNVSPGGPSLRWSAGQYATYWRANNPLYDPITTYMDHFRVATTYAEAEPANWGGGATPTPTATATPAALAGYYKILARHSGKAVAVQSASTANGANVFQWTYGGANTNDEWEVRSIGGGYYRVINRNSGKDLVVESASTADSANIFQWTYGGSNTNDEWAIVSTGGGYYRVTNRNSGKSAEVAGGGTADGTNVDQRTYAGTAYQQFQLVSIP
jgi:hypothetical protein